MLLMLMMVSKTRTKPERGEKGRGGEERERGKRRREGRGGGRSAKSKCQSRRCCTGSPKSWLRRQTLKQSESIEEYRRAALNDIAQWLLNDCAMIDPRLLND